MRTFLLEAATGAAVLAAATLLVASGYSGPTLERARAELARRRPPVVFLGNSTAREGIDEATAAAALGAPAMKLVGDGSGSALWWLLLKNVVAAASAPPRDACVLFRDHELTNPTIGITGRQGMQLAATSGDSEPELDELAYRAAMGPLRHLAHRRWPLWRARDTAMSLLERTVRRDVVGPPFGFAGERSDAVWWNALGDKRMDPARLTRYQLEHEDARAAADLDFEREVGRSFLPRMADVARAAGVRLVLVRIRTRRDALGVPIPARNVRYGERLAAWCAARAIPLLDYRRDAALSESLFGFGDHLTDAGARLFTAKLCDALGRLDEAAASAGPDRE